MLAEMEVKYPTVVSIIVIYIQVCQDVQIKYVPCPISFRNNCITGPAYFDPTDGDDFLNGVCSGRQFANGLYR